MRKRQRVTLRIGVSYRSDRAEEFIINDRTRKSSLVPDAVKVTDAWYVTDEASLIPVPTTRAYTMKRRFLSRVTCIRTNRFLTIQPFR